MDKKSGLFYRENTFDISIIKEVTGCYKQLSLSQKKVMDVGGNIGSFAAFAAKRGALKVFTYEPDPSNFEVLCANIGQLPIEPIRAALIAGDESTTSFFINNGINKGLHSTLPTRGRTELVVPAKKFSSEIESIQPDGFKSGY